MRYLKYLVIVLFVLIAETLYLNYPHKTQIVGSPSKFYLDQDILLENVQKWRSSKKLPRYISSDLLCNIANIRLLQISKNLSHDDFEKTVISSLDNTKYEIGENLSNGYTNEILVLNAWINSPLHLKNLQYNYRYTCIKTSGYQVVQIFGNF